MSNNKTIAEIIDEIIALIEKEEEYQDGLDALEEAMDEDWNRTGFQS